MWGSNVIFIIICHSIIGLSWPRSKNCILFISPIILSYVSLILFFAKLPHGIILGANNDK